MAIDQINREFIANKVTVEGFQFMNTDVLKNLHEQFDNLWIVMHNILTYKIFDIQAAMSKIEQIQGIDTKEALNILKEVENYNIKLPNKKHNLINVLQEIHKK